MIACSAMIEEVYCRPAGQLLGAAVLAVLLRPLQSQ